MKKSFLIVALMLVLISVGAKAYAFGWYGLSDLDWTLGAGDYWTTVEVREGQTLGASLPFPSESPLGEEQGAHWSADTNQWNYGYSNIGIRIGSDSGYIVNTGAGPEVEAGYALMPWQWLGGKFIVGEQTTITNLEYWMRIADYGTGTIAIYENINTVGAEWDEEAQQYIPFSINEIGQELFSQEFRVLDSSPGPHVIPEPATMLLFGTGLVGFAFKRRKA